MTEEITRTYRVDPTFRHLEASLLRLDEIAPVQRAGQIREILTAVPAESRPLILVELIKSDLAAAADVGLNRRLDFYLTEFTDCLPTNAVPADLVLEEFQLRREAGEDPAWESYRARFPGLAATMARMLQIGEATSRCETRVPLPEFAIQQTIDDFRILGLLGQGAFARVYLARQESMQRLVALKATQRGSDEPQALSQLDHPNIVRVYDQRVCVAPSVRLLYMQYVPGGTLADCIELARNKPVADWSGRLIIESVDRSLTSAGQVSPESSPIRAVLAEHDWATAVTWLGIQLAEGLHYAHSRGVLHRDIKPANILLSGDGVPKLADFNVSFNGLAGRAGAAAHFGGSLAYMSPEQLRAADPTDETSAAQLDNRSDLFSLGVVLWELFHGQRPWQIVGGFSNWTGAIKAQLASREVRLPPVPLAKAGARVLDQVLRRTLATSPEERPRTGAELAGALRLALYPDVAEQFHPAPDSVAGRLHRLPTMLLLVAIALVPNMAAALFNYLYNEREIAVNYPALWPKFATVSLIVNSILFPVGIVVGMSKLLPVARTVRAARDKFAANEGQIRDLWSVGHFMAGVSGALWMVGGLILPVTMVVMDPSFRWVDAAHFFVSLAICGGVAMTYPFFGITLVSLLYYYPRVIRWVMSDPGFDVRQAATRRRCQRYLGLATAVPLLALFLLVLRDQAPRIVLLATIATTALGLVASYFANQAIVDGLRRMAAVLAPRRALARMGES
jgi:hypothetical protein